MKLESLKNMLILIVGKRNSGKSQMSMHLTRKFAHHFDKVFLISPSGHLTGEWRSTLGSKSDDITFADYDEKWMIRLIDEMSAVNKGKTAHDKTQRHVLLILDDVVSTGSNAGHYSNSLKRLVAGGRHIGITTLVTSQHLHSVNPLLRANADLVMFSKLNAASIQIAKDAYDCHGMHAKDWAAFLSKNTNDYTFLVIFQSAGSTDAADDIYSTYKIPAKELRS